MIAFVEQETAPLRVIREAQPGMIYTLGADAATGLGSDYSCAQVLTNTIPCQQVAVFRQQCPVHEFGEIIDRLGRYYNEALIVCEVNYPGNSVQEALVRYFNYPRNYQSETHLEEDFDISSKFGFRTTEASKWLLINEMQVALDSNGIKINDPTTLDELRNFVYQESKRKAGAASGFNDDAVMALMLAYHGAKLYPCIIPNQPKEVAKKSKDPDTLKAWRNFRLRIGTSRKKVIL